MPRLALAFRRYNPRTDGWQNWLTTWVSRNDASYPTAFKGDQLHDICHVEILVEIQCAGQSCVYCTPEKRLKELHSYRTHSLAFSVTGLADRDTVYYTDDRPYEATELSPGEPMWVFYACDLAATEMVGVSYFLHEQLRKPFNRWGLFVNFMTLPCSSRRLGRWGCHYREDHNYLYYVESERHGWFCSELATACVQWMGVCGGEHPCYVTPNRLYAAVSNHPRFYRVPTQKHPLRSWENLNRTHDLWRHWQQQQQQRQQRSQKVSSRTHHPTTMVGSRVSMYAHNPYLMEPVINDYDL